LSERPLVSVIIPTWNRAKEVRVAIDSLLAQTYQPLEIVVVDDGSTDDTPATLAAYVGRIKTLRQANSGASAARNAGIKVSSGAMIGFLDSDDEWRADKVEIQMALLDAAGPDTVLSIANSTEIWETGKVLTSFEANRFRPGARSGMLDNPAEIILSRFLLFNPNALVRRETLCAAGLFDETLEVLEDYQLALTLSFMGPWCYTMTPLATIHRGAPCSLTLAANQDGRRAQDCLLRIYERLQSDGRTLTPLQARLLNRGLARARRRLAWVRDGGPSATMRLWDRVCLAAWLRSPFFPRPAVRPLTAPRAGRATLQAKHEGAS
jgi:glycosyltransferase involved in cell wall biosynthesis